VEPQPVKALAAAGVFLVVLIVATLITMKMADFIIDSRIGALDRTLGFVYGAARGIVVMAVAFLFLTWLLGSNPPTWVAEAKSRPLLEGVGTYLKDLLPDDSETSILDRLSPRSADDAATSN